MVAVVGRTVMTDAGARQLALLILAGFTAFVTQVMVR